MCIEFRGHTELRASVGALSRALSSEDTLRIRAMVWGGALSTEVTLNSIVQSFGTVHGVRTNAELRTIVWDGVQRSEGTLSSVLCLGAVRAEVVVGIAHYTIKYQRSKAVVRL